MCCSKESCAIFGWHFLTRMVKCSILLVTTTIFLMQATGVLAQSNSARINYLLNCQGCHSADGKGSAGGAPDMTLYGKEFLQSAPGRRFFIQVPGSSNSSLSNLELADVLNFIASELIQYNEAIQFTETEVEQYRGTKISNVVETRNQLILELVR
ncbi:c-type cytochrome [Sessilibacter corallicola]